MASYWADAGAGVAGNTTDFPTITSGKGGNNRWGNIYGGAAASGGGASGGGGGYGGGNDSDNVGGAGGGGAGGSLDAGGGKGGTSYNQYSGTAGGDGYNPHTTPTASTDYAGAASNLGRGGNGQTSSQAATNGYNGWFYIVSTKIGT